MTCVSLDCTPSVNTQQYKSCFFKQSAAGRPTKAFNMCIESFVLLTRAVSPALIQASNKCGKEGEDDEPEGTSRFD